MSRQLYVPPTFSNFGKSNLFQVYDKDSLDHTVKSVTKTANGTTFESGLVFAPKSNPRGYVKTNFGLNGVVVDAQVQTDSSKVSSIAFKKKNVLAKALPGINASVSVTSSEKDFSGKPKYGFFTNASADYSHNNFTASAGVITDEDSNHAVSASTSVGFDGFAVGGDAKFVKTADSAFQAKSYNAGLAYANGKYSGALVSDSKFEKLKATVLASKLGSTGAWALGAQAKVDLQAPKAGAPQREVIVSVEEVASKQTTYRLAAVVTSGTIVASIEHRLTNPSLTLTAAGVTQLPNSAFAPFAITKFGVGIAFGEQ